MFILYQNTRDNRIKPLSKNGSGSDQKYQDSDPPSCKCINIVISRHDKKFHSKTQLHVYTIKAKGKKIAVAYFRINYYEMLQ